MTPLKITVGQYLGFTVIIAISLIGFGVAVALPSQPIGFLGLLPILLGVWKFFNLLFPWPDNVDEQQPTSSLTAKAKPILKVSIITIMNGGDNIGVYVPLFSQAKGAEIAVYVVVYYILLGVWCLVACLIMKQKHVLRLAQKYASILIPFLYLGLGIYIVIKSDCYPWSIQRIDEQFIGNPGKTIMGVVTACLLSSIMGIMVWARMRRQSGTMTSNDEIVLTRTTAPIERRDIESRANTRIDHKHVENISNGILTDEVQEANFRSTEVVASSGSVQLREDPEIQIESNKGGEMSVTS